MPKHIFHSFGVCTIAAVMPFPMGTGAGNGFDQDTSTTLDTWFIGAFGRWWRGGVVEAWFHDVVHRAEDGEGWRSGILGFKALDKSGDHSGEWELAFSFLPMQLENIEPKIVLNAPHAYIGFPSGKTNLRHRGSPPKLRNRERSLSRRLRDSPPLPKLASLPLHTTRLPSLLSSTSDHRHPEVDSRSTNINAASQWHPQWPTSPTSLSSSTLLEQSLIIVEVLRQISSSNTTVHELRTQLNEFQSAASESHTLLQSEVDLHKERRQQEETARMELKARTKTWEDSKRHAEDHRRDAEKRLKAAQSAKDDCTQRMAHLDSEITRLEQRSLDDQVAMEQNKIDISKAEQDISDVLDRKKQEIKVAEDVIVALSARAKELHEKLIGERERLRLGREQAEIALSIRHRSLSL
jgi:hypothetical protein